MLAGMLRGGLDYAVMEVSSHALDQNRIDGIDFHSAIFTNLTQDHLDYHGTLGNYFQAKSRLFRSLGLKSFAVLNNDDSYGRRLEKLTPAKIVTYAIDSPADLTARDIKFNIEQTEFILETRKVKVKIKTKLIARHNVYNLLAAAAWAISEGIGLTAIKSALEKFSCVPGRLERVGEGKGFKVFVDYAHTPDALKNALTSLRELSGNRLIVVFGCGGERDQTKRPKMGRCVTALADFAIITNDNPRSENPRKIINDIKKGIRKNNYTVIPGRHEAIVEALRIAEPADIVLIAGKGHEGYQVLKDKILPFDDRKVVKECLQSMS